MADTIRRLAVLAALSLALGVVSPGASATVTCPDGTLCFWAGFSQVPPQVNINDAHKISNKLAREMNNQASSVENDTAFAVFVYAKRDGRGERICIPPDGVAHDLVSFNDRASSTKVKRHATCPT